MKSISLASCYFHPERFRSFLAPIDVIVLRIPCYDGSSVKSSYLTEWVLVAAGHSSRVVVVSFVSLPTMSRASEHNSFFRISSSIYLILAVLSPVQSIIPRIT